MKISKAYIQHIAVNPLEIKAAEISNMIFNKFKDWVQKYAGSVNAGADYSRYWVFRVDSPINEDDLIVHVDLYPNMERPFLQVTGTTILYDNDDVELKIKIATNSFFHKANEQFPYGFYYNMKDKVRHDISQHYEQLNYDLKEIVRHELEHLEQFSGEDKPDVDNRFRDMKPSEDFRDYSDEKSINYWRSYLGAQHEVEAYVTGFYYEAKKTKTSFFVVLDDFFKHIYYKNVINYQEKNKVRFAKILKEIQDKYIEYAKSRYPEILKLI